MSIEWKSVESSNVDQVACNRGDLLVKFKSNKDVFYRYKGAGSELGTVMEASSVGREISGIKRRYECIKETVQEGTVLHLEITGAAVVHTSGTDQVYINANLPSPFPQFGSQLLSLKFEAPKGTGSTYLKDHFGITDPRISGI